MKPLTGIAIIEAILFASGDPVSLDRLSEAGGFERDMTVALLDQLERRYNVTESGLRVIRLGNAFQITTRTEYSAHVKAALEAKKQTPLSPAAMESLAIIAYNQPVTKSFVEQVRGVDSGGVVNTLVERELIEEAGRLDLPGRPISYRTTDGFLRCFGLSSLQQLPVLPDSQEQLSFDTFEEYAGKEKEINTGDIDGNEVEKDNGGENEIGSLE